MHGPHESYMFSVSMQAVAQRGPTRRQASAERVPLTARRGAPALLGALGVVAVLVLAELVSRLGIVDARDIPPASAVIRELVDELGASTFWQQVGDTMAGWAVGLAIAVVAGIVIGLVLGSSIYAWSALRPTIEFLRPVPSVALIPFAILVWGQDLGSKVFLIVFGALWVMVIQTMYGVSQVDDVARATARSFGLSRVDRVRYLIVPSALPFIATGLRIASATALIVGVTAEVVIGNPGLGSAIALAQSAGNTEKMYALILATGLLGVAIHVVFSGFERRLLHWHTSQRGGAT
jgi:ABC-type nitrate/sulfonate/bicarbonate transport system permease component